MFDQISNVSPIEGAAYLGYGWIASVRNLQSHAGVQ